MIRKWQIKKFKSANYSAMALFPFIFLKNSEDIHNERLLNHEFIHFRQQIEMLLIGFYLCYGLNYLINRVRYKTHNEAYSNIVFEREAYAKDSELEYLKHRPAYAWLKYL